MSETVFGTGLRKNPEDVQDTGRLCLPSYPTTAWLAERFQLRNAVVRSPVCLVACLRRQSPVEARSDVGPVAPDSSFCACK